MTPIVLLSAMLLGQCGPNGCPDPTVVGQARPYFVIKDHAVNHEGLNFTVRGYRNGEGKITWHPSEYGNLAAWDAAKAAKPRAVIVRPERAPTAVAGPEPDRPAPVLPNGVRRPAPTLAPVPDRLIGQTTDVPNYGLSPDKMRGNSTYTTTGEAARRFVIEAQAPGDREPPKLHVTVIGSDDARAPVVNDLATHPEFASLKSHLMVQDYKPGEWPVDASLGFVTDGKPTIIVQSAKGPSDPRGGRVIFRASDYESGPKGLAEAIRKADPNYKPNADPGPQPPANPFKPAVCPLGFDHSHWPYLIGAAVVLFLLFKLPRKEG